ncbi:hypothetical protein ACFQ1I_07640 [Kitasatospora arboriphila]
MSSAALRLAGLSLGITTAWNLARGAPFRVSLRKPAAMVGRPAAARSIRVYGTPVLSSSATIAPTAGPPSSTTSSRRSILGVVAAYAPGIGASVMTRPATVQAAAIRALRPMRCPSPSDGARVARRVAVRIVRCASAHCGVRVVTKNAALKGAAQRHPPPHIV